MQYQKGVFYLAWMIKKGFVCYKGYVLKKFRAAVIPQIWLDAFFVSDGKWKIGKFAVNHVVEDFGLE